MGLDRLISVSWVSACVVMGLDRLIGVSWVSACVLNRW